MTGIRRRVTSLLLSLLFGALLTCGAWAGETRLTLEHEDPNRGSGLARFFSRHLALGQTRVSPASSGDFERVVRTDKGKSHRSSGNNLKTSAVEHN